MLREPLFVPTGTNETAWRDDGQVTTMKAGANIWFPAVGNGCLRERTRNTIRGTCVPDVVYELLVNVIAQWNDVIEVVGPNDKNGFVALTECQYIPPN